MCPREPGRRRAHTHVPAGVRESPRAWLPSGTGPTWVLLQPLSVLPTPGAGHGPEIQPHGAHCCWAGRSWGIVMGG